MAETFDSALRDYQDELERSEQAEFEAQKEKAQAELDRLAPFEQWLNDNGLSCKAKKDNESAWLEFDGGYIWVDSLGYVHGSDPSAKTLGAVLWQMFENR